jgi:hypothetical protein
LESQNAIAQSDSSLEIVSPITLLPLPEDARCCLCLETYNNQFKFHLCDRCGNHFHHPDDCICGETQVLNARGEKYCSRKCFRNTAIFEVEIIAENNRYYSVKFNDGDTKRVLKKHLDGYLDHYSIVQSWRNKSAQKVIEQKQHVSKRQRKDRDINVVSSIAQNTSSEIIIISENNQEIIEDNQDYNLNHQKIVKKCKACDETLSDSNWHCCHSCKAPLHGVIICPNRERIVQDDDKLYCSVECSKKQH